ncbi:MAG: hypothetical protein CEO21_434 [Microgenomates group bacterium Gr01-1014_80]|nr:MAG: hypothetical protein CEO21_434 [Microgenomates group bacterium Gr01-1014_80]
MSFETTFLLLMNMVLLFALTIVILVKSNPKS